jgi:nicotinate-nucleotide pyrophosphorylase (carboxylating)
MRMAMKTAEIFSSYSFKVPVIIMFDNITPAIIRKTLDALKKSGYYKDYLFESSGGITLENIHKFAKSGVDIISVGALTHSVPGLNISMNFIK